MIEAEKNITYRTPRAPTHPPTLANAHLLAGVGVVARDGRVGGRGKGGQVGVLRERSTTVVGSQRDHQVAVRRVDDIIHGHVDAGDCGVLVGHKADRQDLVLRQKRVSGRGVGKVAEEELVGGGGVVRASEKQGSDNQDGSDRPNSDRHAGMFG